MKKFLGILFCLAMLLSLTATGVGCGKNHSQHDDEIGADSDIAREASDRDISDRPNGRIAMKHTGPGRPGLISVVGANIPRVQGISLGNTKTGASKSNRFKMRASDGDLDQDLTETSELTETGDAPSDQPSESEPPTDGDIEVTETETPDVGITVDFSAVNPAFEAMYVPRLPLWKEDTGNVCFIYPGIIKILPSGNISTLYSYGIETQTEMCAPRFTTSIEIDGQKLKEAVGYRQDTTVDSNGTLYYANYRSNSVDRFSPEGIKETFVGNLPNVTSILYHDGYIYIAITPSYEDDNPQMPTSPAKILQASIASQEVSEFAVFPIDMQSWTPYGGAYNSRTGMLMPMAMDDSDVLHVANNLDNTIYVITADGAIQPFVNDVWGVTGLVFNSHNNFLYAVGVEKMTRTEQEPVTKTVVTYKAEQTPSIYAISPDGTVTIFYSIPLNKDANYAFNLATNPTVKPLTYLQITIDERENLYISDSHAGTVIGVPIEYSPECNPTAEGACNTSFDAEWVVPVLDGDMDDEANGESFGDVEGELVGAVYNGLCLPDSVSTLGGYCLTNCWVDGAPDKSACNSKQICQPVSNGDGGGYCAYPCSLNSHCGGGFCSTADHPWGAGVCLPNPNPPDGDLDESELPPDGDLDESNDSLPPDDDYETPLGDPDEEAMPSDSDQPADEDLDLAE